MSPNRCLQALEALGGVGEVVGALGLGFLDQRADPVDELAGGQRAADGFHHLVETAHRHRAGVDRLPSGRLFAQFGNVHVAEIGQHQRARDRRRAQHQHVDGLALGGQRQAFAHAEAMLLVDHRERERLEDHVVLDQRMGADQKIDLAGRKPRQDIAALLALFAAGEDRDPQTRTLGQRRDGLDVLAREDFGRRHQCGLLADLGDGSGGQQRHHGLARADIALQQPQHADRLAQIVGDRSRGLLLRRRQRIGQRVDDPAAQMAVAGVAVARGPAQLRPHQRQRQLTGQQFVEGKPRPIRTIGQDIRQLDRHMHAVQRFGDRRKFAAADHFRTDPLRQLRQLLQRLRHRAPQRAERQPFRERIDGIDARQFCETCLIDHPVGMHDLRHAVEHLQGAGDVTLRADRQQFLDVTGLGAKIGQHHVAGIVAGIDQMRRAGIAGGRWPMAVDRHLQCHHGSGHRIADLRPRAAIDHARRQMQQQVDQPWRLVAAEQIAKQFVLFRPDAGKARDRRKQRIEQERAHR